MNIPYKHVLLLYLSTALILLSCSERKGKIPSPLPNHLVLTQTVPNNFNEISTEPILTDSGSTIKARINPPKGYTRINTVTNSYADYLQELPLKPSGALVKYYDGATKNNNHVYCAVVDLPIGKKNLHQCADAIMRLRAEYLWNAKKYDAIHFNFTNGFTCDYVNWMNGKRVSIKDNKTTWYQYNNGGNTYQDFWKYMEMIFSYAGTLSLSRELEAVEYHNMEIGDIFIQGGSPGHAITVVDMAENPETNKKVYLLAQSYMPAQETQILINPNNASISPWYALDSIDVIYTPEWRFYPGDLKRFGE
jgi:hypothetical protein